MIMAIWGFGIIVTVIGLLGLLGILATSINHNKGCYEMRQPYACSLSFLVAGIIIIVIGLVCTSKYSG
jgi:hypothetical protein